MCQPLEEWKQSEILERPHITLKPEYMRQGGGGNDNQQRTAQPRGKLKSMSGGHERERRPLLVLNEKAPHRHLARKLEDRQDHRKRRRNTQIRSTQQSRQDDVPNERKAVNGTLANAQHDTAMENGAPKTHAGSSIAGTAPNLIRAGWQNRAYMGFRSEAAIDPGASSSRQRVAILRLFGIARLCFLARDVAHLGVVGFAVAIAPSNIQARSSFRKRISRA